MMTSAATRRAEELAAQGTAFVTATVVRAQRPTSVQAGNVALVLGDGTIDGFVGGACAEHSVRLHSLRVLESGEALLLRILPDAPEGAPPGAHPLGHTLEGAGRQAVGPEGAEGAEGATDDIAHEDGAVTVQNPCLSGGAIEVFLEPFLPAPRVLVMGETPIARAVGRLGPELGLDVVFAQDGVLDPAGGDLALIVAAHGRDELDILRRGLEAGLPYVGLVASQKRGSAVIEELRADGVAEEQLDRLETPAGIEIGAHTPAEIALSILAQIVAVRRRGAAPALAATIHGATTHGATTHPTATHGATTHPTATHGATTHPAAAAPAGSGPPVVAVDPICGMTVVAVAGTPSVGYDGETVYFCCEGCKVKFEAQHEHAAAAT